jgi:hypothetical protein
MTGFLWGLAALPIALIVFAALGYGLAVLAAIRGRNQPRY